MKHCRIGKKQQIDGLHDGKCGEDQEKQFHPGKNLLQISKVVIRFGLICIPAYGIIFIERSVHQKIL